MVKENNVESGKVDIIPDFFHDIIAYIIPGYTALILFVCNIYIIGLSITFLVKDIGLKEYSLSLIVAYVIGRFFEQVGLMTIHRRKLPFFNDSSNIKSPKWSLIFDPTDIHYTEPFKKNVAKKIESWLDKQDGTVLLSCCKDKGKDDYFNLIQFYLRERFPSVALYEKKQNATIVLTRSLAIVFVFNMFIFFMVQINLRLQSAEMAFSLPTTCWLVGNLAFSYIFYKRFQQDKIYHAMYIFETFIAMKKLLKSKSTRADDKATETIDC